MLLHFSGASAWAATSDALQRCHEHGISRLHQGHRRLAALDELVPWLQQWHNAIDPDFGERMGDCYAAFVRDEARALGFTLEELRGWQPVVVAKKRGRKAKT